MSTETPALSPLPRLAIRHDVVDRLLLGMFEGDLPAGSKLIVQKLTAQFGVSSTPVREALVELESIGVVEFVHNRGVVVKPFGRRQLREIFHLRKILETEAARGASGHIGHDALTSLEKELTELAGSRSSRKHWADREMASDRQLHELIATHCGSDRLAEEIRRYNRLIQTIREIVGDRRRAQQRALDEHRTILKALLENDAEAAAKAMAVHIDNTAKAVEEVIFRDSD